MDSNVRQLVWERSRGFCEFCGLPLDPESFDFHHRQGTTKLDLVANGIAACHFCHVIAPKSIHQNPRIARDRGFIISRYADASTFSQVPLLLFGGLDKARGRLVVLTSDAKYGMIVLDNSLLTVTIKP